MQSLVVVLGHPVKGLVMAGQQARQRRLDVKCAGHPRLRFVQVSRGWPGQARP